VNKTKQSLLASAVLMLLPMGAQAGLINGGFESPSFTPGSPDFSFIDAASLPGWNTTAADNVIEIWSDGFQGIPAYEGTQFAELNANLVSTLFQDSDGIASGSILGFEFAHRGRLGIDTLRLDITDLGLDGVFGTADDSLLFSKEYADGNQSWGFYTSAGEAPIVALGNTVRFSYVSVSAAGGNSVGNFIDAADFGVGVAQPIPEPMTLSMILAGLVPVYRLSKRT
jgi:hypothetical protein